MIRDNKACYRYVAKRPAGNKEIADWLRRLTDAHRTWGFGLCFLYLRHVKGFPWNHRRVYRIYREMVLNLRIRPRRRLAREKPEPLAVPSAINQVWFMDFMHDQMENGRGLRRRWAERRRVRLAYIQPGKPQQNAYVERFNRTVRHESLSQYNWAGLEALRRSSCSPPGGCTTTVTTAPHGPGWPTPKQRLAMTA